MTIAGIDIGSRTTKIVVLRENDSYDFSIADTGLDPVEQSKQLMAENHFDRIFATGYGRHLAKEHFADNVITEIKAYALGARYLYPDCRTIIDIGGQDSKVIAIGADGKFADFEMNDRCAAGTGKFLEVMADTLQFTIDKFGDEALKVNCPVNINSMCTVFSESEVVSLISKGEDRRRIALGLHESVANRTVSMVKKMGIAEEIVFAGGVAKSACLHHLLEKKLGRTIKIPEEPQILGALGAALEARDAS